jgi:hypothetical protein
MNIPEGTIFIQPKNTLPKITEIFAFVSVDEADGNEGLVGAPMGPVGCMPLIAADKKRLENLMPIAQAIADATKMNIRLIKLTQREEVGFITPKE